MTRVRVLNVIGSLGVGGAETYLSRVSPALRELGVDVEICALDRVGALVAHLEAAGILVHGTRFSDRSRGQTVRKQIPTLVRTVADVRALVRRGRFDIVHSYLFFADLVATAAVATLPGIRMVTSRRAEHAWRHRSVLYEHWLELASNLLADELIANSKRVLEDVLRYERFVPRRRTVIYNGIDVSALPSARPGSERSRLRLVSVGALAPRKGYEYALRAIRCILDGGFDAHLDVVGSGPDERMLERLTSELCLTANVTFSGERDPRPHLAGADLFILASRQEGFSNALLEAMGASLPCIVTDVGGNAEAIVDGSGGHVVPPGDPAALADAIIDLASDPERLIACGEFNRRRVEERFTLQASAHHLARWYTSY